MTRVIRASKPINMSNTDFNKIVHKIIHFSNNLNHFEFKYYDTDTFENTTLRVSDEVYFIIKDISELTGQSQTKITASMVQMLSDYPERFTDHATRVQSLLNKLYGLGYDVTLTERGE